MVRKCGVWLVGMLTFASAVQAGDEPAVAVVQRLNDALLATLKEGESLGFDGRFARLQPAMRQAFDLDFMAEKSLGRHWNDLADDDRAKWRELFAEFTVANYAANFDRFTGQRFEVIGEEASANDTVMVRTTVSAPGAEPVALTYRLHQNAGRWRIIDVFLKGTVSELALRRSEYASVLARDGFEALSALLKERIGDLAAGRAKRERP